MEFELNVNSYQLTNSCVGAGQNLNSNSTSANIGSSIENLSTWLHC